MSYNNNQYNSFNYINDDANDDANDDILDDIINGVGLGAILIFIWILLAYYYYRYSLDRIKNKLITSYTNSNSDKIDMEKEYVMAKNIVYDVNKNTVVADMFVYDAITVDQISNEKVKFTILDNCNYKVNCITL
jgi:hypothetical protein